jgi:hypothetical protein
MTIHSTKIGPGALQLGGALDAEAQCRSCVVQVTENVETSDAVPVLSGEELPEQQDASYSYALACSFLQDLGQPAASGIVAYSWAHAGETVAFTYTPNNGAAAGSKTVSGELRVIPLNIGGEAGPDPASSDVTFAIIGTPALA